MPPGGSVAYGCTLHFHTHGPLEGEITLFLEDNGIREVTLRVHGVVVPEDRTHDRSVAP